MTIEEIRKNAPDGSTHYAYGFEDWVTYLKMQSWGYTCPYSGLIISEFDLLTLEIKPLYP